MTTFLLPVEVTFMESVVIVDECQDMDYQDFRTILTRVGKNSKIIFCGSEQQVDKSINVKSCISKILTLKDSGLVGFTELTANHRNESLIEIINYLENEK